VGDIEHGRRLIEQAFPGAAVAAYRRTLIKECAAGAVVGRLPWDDVPTMLLVETERYKWWRALPAIPIANGPPGDERLREVAAQLAVTWRITPADDGRKRLGPPPFAAAYHDSGGVRHYVLVAGECDVCDDAAELPSTDLEPLHRRPCPKCIDVGAVARRYGGDGGSRVARFEVKL
jgi:hypothetical protein